MQQKIQQTTSRYLDTTSGDLQSFHAKCARKKFLGSRFKKYSCHDRSAFAHAGRAPTFHGVKLATWDSRNDPASMEDHPPHQQLDMAFWSSSLCSIGGCSAPNTVGKRSTNTFAVVGVAAVVSRYS